MSYNFSQNIRIEDKEFSLLLDPIRIQEKIAQLAQQIQEDYADKNPVLLIVLNGAFRFAADLIRHMQFPLEISFIRLQSYAGTQQSGSIKETMSLDISLEGRHVLLIEDIVDTGDTLNYLREKIKALNPASLKEATLLLKPKPKLPLGPVQYRAFEIDDQFVLGFGLDYKQKGRELSGIYVLVPPKHKEN